MTAGLEHLPAIHECLQGDTKVSQIRFPWHSPPMKTYFMTCMTILHIYIYYKLHILYTTIPESSWTKYISPCVVFFSLLFSPKGSVAFTFVLPTLWRIAYRSTCRKAYGPWEGWVLDPCFVVLGSWCSCCSWMNDECLMTLQLLTLLSKKPNWGKWSHVFFFRDCMTTSYDAAKEWGRQGKVGIVICISRYVYMMKFESASAFLDQLFKKRPTPANYTHSQLRKKVHWSDIQQILTFTFGFIHCISIWFTIGPRLSSTQQTTNSQSPWKFPFGCFGMTFLRWTPRMFNPPSMRPMMVGIGSNRMISHQEGMGDLKKIGKFTTKKLL